ncbi:MAG: AAA family ATPase [Gemmatimonadales bacterium]
MIHLRALSAKAARDACAPGAPDGDGDGGRFPFTVPAVRSLTSLEFTSPVTFFVGENGSGKSTLLEGIAAAAGLPAVGSADVPHDRTLAAGRELAAAFRLTWTRHPHRGFFLRAEDFFGFTKRLSTMRAELTARLAQLDVEYADRSAYAKGLASLPVATSLHDMTRRYGVDLDANSHGESFLRLFRNRFVPGGLYLLDEPEAPLSPHSQLALLAMLDEMVQEDAQFIIATHSPILLAYPGATILSFDELPVRQVEYEALDHVTVTRGFLNEPGRYLRHLIGRESGAESRESADLSCESRVRV